MLLVFAGCVTVGGTDSVLQESQPTNFAANPDDAKFVTSDIDRFWWAFDEATADNDMTIYKREYLDEGSTGLKEFERMKIVNSLNFASKVWKHERYYASIRPGTRLIPKQEARVREMFRRLKELYPDAIFPNVYFVIGCMNSGGVALPDGVVIGVELFTKAPSSPLDELNTWEKSVVQPVEKIPLAVVHELIHFQQHSPEDSATLLARSIVEGGADFLTHLIAGSEINEIQHRYGDQHEQEIWREFKAEMSGKDYSRWLYNGGTLASTGQPIERPADLGYYVGYKICEAYYDNAIDKKKAVREILQIQDFSHFLMHSGYGAEAAANR